MSHVVEHELAFKLGLTFKFLCHYCMLYKSKTAAIKIVHRRLLEYCLCTAICAGLQRAVLRTKSPLGQEDICIHTCSAVFSVV